MAIVCEVCPPNLEATVISSFTSISNFFNEVSGILGSGLMYLLKITKDDQSNLWIAQAINVFLFAILISILVLIKFPKKEEL